MESVENDSYKKNNSLGKRTRDESEDIEEGPSTKKSK